MNDLRKSGVTWDEVDGASAGQRIDNFLLKTLKGVPKSHIYRILSSGEVRVNSRRIQPNYRLKEGDQVRIPPVRLPQRGATGASPAAGPSLLPAIVWEDDALIALNKPAGLAVHGGSGITLGVIEQLRLERPEAPFMELVHRLDRDTSGLLLLAKKRSALTAMHEMLRGDGIDKRYLVVVAGRWHNARQQVKLGLRKYVTADGERRVSVDEEGQASHTIFRLVKAWQDYSLLEAELKTGRTHQIRVQLAHLGFPVAGDDKYGDFADNKSLAKGGLKRMFLHAARLAFDHPLTGERIELEAPLPPALQSFVDQLEAA